MSAPGEFPDDPGTAEFTPARAPSQTRAPSPTKILSSHEQAISDRAEAQLRQLRQRNLQPSISESELVEVNQRPAMPPPTRPTRTAASPALVARHLRGTSRFDERDTATLEGDEGP